MSRLLLLTLAALAALTAAERITPMSSLDDTLKPEAKGADVVERTLEIIRTACVFDDDKLFMRRLAYVESKDGAEPNTFRQDYNGGIWQVDEDMFDKLKEPASRTALSKYTKEFKTELGVDWEQTTWADLRKPRVSALSARLYIQLARDDIPRDIDDQGTFWSSNYRAGADKQEFIDDANKLNKGCDEISGVDLAFLLDSSGSITKSNFNDMKDFVADVVESFDIGSTTTRVSVTKFSTKATTEFYFNKYTKKSDVVNKVKAIRHDQGSTNTHLGLDKVVNDVFTEGRGARSKTSGIPRVVIVLTDGRSNSPSSTALSALRLHQADITAFAIGVGSGADKNELEEIASDPTCLYMFMLSGFSEVESLKYAIQKGTCDAPIIVRPGTNGTEVDGKVPSGGDQNCKIKVPAGGTTIKIAAKTGGVEFFVSTNTYPSAAYYEAAVKATPGHPGVIFVEKPSTPDAEGVVYCNIKGDDKTDSDLDVDIVPGDKDFCKDADCKNGGSCVDDLHSGYTCSCRRGFEGKHCEQVTDPCNSNPCMRGFCITSSDGKYSCDCLQGWKGLRCDEVADGCSSQPCIHGNCTGLGMGFECCCDHGYTGKTCNEDIDECRSNPCVHGQCVDQINRYRCDCQPGFRGVHCDYDIDECASNPCVHGDCEDLVNGYRCTCAPGWEGDRCNENIDDCTPNRCQHNGACIDGVNSFTCSCENGYTGALCEIDIDECAPGPCVHGTCTDRVNGYVCSCDSGWDGRICDHDINECLSAPCQHGNCVDRVNYFLCNCHYGFEGVNCEIDTDECSSNPCRHGGTCSDRINGYVCRCAPGYKGIHCEIDIDDCAPKPCMHGTCGDLVNDYHCTCQKGWEGKNCDCLIDNCARSPCKHGVCINAIGSFTCTCDRGYEGTTCADRIGVSTPRPTPNPPPIGNEGHDCKMRNPCTPENIKNKNFYFTHTTRDHFVQCDNFGGCFVMPCAPGTVWSQSAYTCVHA